MNGTEKQNKKIARTRQCTGKGLRPSEITYENNIPSEGRKVKIIRENPVFIFNFFGDRTPSRLDKEY